MTDTDEVYSKARDAVADILDGMGYDEEAYDATDVLINRLDTAGYMVWPKREDWKRLDQLEAERDQLLAILRKIVTDGDVSLQRDDPHDPDYTWLAFHDGGIDVTPAEDALLESLGAVVISHPRERAKKAGDT